MNTQGNERDQTEPNPEVFTVREVAKKLGIGKRQAYLAVKDGVIPAIRIGQRILIPKRPFESWLNAASSSTEVTQPSIDTSSWT